MPALLEMLEGCGISNPIICSSINIDGFRMSGGKKLYEETLKTKNVRAIAMQVLSGGAANPERSIEYVCSLPNIESILFGASSKENIINTIGLIKKYSTLNTFKSESIAI
jgi:predicted aldo/keto reductase-like oxidoreductase